MGLFAFYARAILRSPAKLATKGWSLACAGRRSAKKAMTSHIVLVPRKRRQLSVALFHCETDTCGA
jgi:hypothetical protein